MQKASNAAYKFNRKNLRSLKSSRVYTLDRFIWVARKPLPCRPACSQK